METVQDRHVEKIAIFSQALANANHKPSKFGDAAKKYLESNLKSIVSPIDVRFLADSLNRLGVISKPIFERLEFLIGVHINSYNYNNLKQIIYSTRKNYLYSPKIYELITNRTMMLVEDSRNVLLADQAKFLFIAFRGWKINDKKFEDIELAGKLKDIAGIYP